MAKLTEEELDIIWDGLEAYQKASDAEDARDRAAERAREALATWPSFTRVRLPFSADTDEMWSVQR